MPIIKIWRPRARQMTTVTESKVANQTAETKLTIEPNEQVIKVIFEM